MRIIIRLAVYLLILLLFKPFVLAGISFAPPVYYSVGSWPAWVAAKDLNGDGSVDLICRNSGDFSISILTNTGTGTFASAPAPAVDGGVMWLAPAAINGNDRLDLICESYYNLGELSLMTNNGAGGFALSSKLQMPYPPGDVMAADVNHDGKTDLILAAFQTISVYTNDGLGNIPFNAPYLTGSWQKTGPVAMMAEDVNGDGMTDIICANGYANNFNVLTNDGHGTLILAGSPQVGSGPYQCAAADLNGDGKMDLISANGGTNSLTVLTNDGRGGFVTACTISQDGSPVSVAVADLNGDGKPEIFCANESTNCITVMTNDGHGGFAKALSLEMGAGAPTWVTAADVNNDGKLDLIVADINGNRLWVFINTTSFAPPTSIPTLNVTRLDGQMVIQWPLDSPGWSLQQNPDLSSPKWSAAGYGNQEIISSGTNKRLTVFSPMGNIFFRLIHP